MPDKTFLDKLESELEAGKQLQTMDNIRLAWEMWAKVKPSFSSRDCEVIVAELLIRLAPIVEDYHFEPWGWDTGGEPIIYHQEIYDAVADKVVRGMNDNMFG